jgi:hypothetical protein
LLIRAQGFIESTLVLTNRGKIPLSELSVLDKVMSITYEDVTQYAQILKLRTRSTPCIVEIKTAKDCFTCAWNQEWYIPRLNKWVYAIDLKITDKLYAVKGKNISIKKISHDYKKTDILTLDIEEPHTAVVGKEEILVRFFCVECPLGMCCSHYINRLMFNFFKKK